MGPARAARPRRPARPQAAGRPRPGRPAARQPALAGAVGEARKRLPARIGTVGAGILSEAAGPAPVTQLEGPVRAGARHTSPNAAPAVEGERAFARFAMMSV